MTSVSSAGQAGASNRGFAAVVGCSPTMASRLRNGKRRPSGELLIKIIREYELDYEDATKAYSAGAPAFGVYLRSTVFNPMWGLESGNDNGQRRSDDGTRGTGVAVAA